MSDNTKKDWSKNSFPYNGVKLTICNNKPIGNTDLISITIKQMKIIKNYARKQNHSQYDLEFSLNPVLHLYSNGVLGLTQLLSLGFFQCLKCERFAKRENGKS